MSTAKAWLEEGASMTWDALLYWMTHVGAGRWASFKRGVAELSGSDGDPSIARALRVWLSDLGHAEFFVNGTSQWKMNSSLLAGLAGQTGIAVLCGARTPRLLTELQEAVNSCGGAVVVEESDRHPSTIFVHASEAMLVEVAQRLHISVSANHSLHICADAMPLMALAMSAQSSRPLQNWQHRCFNFNSLDWTEHRLSHTAHEYKSRYGETHYFVSMSNRKLVRLPKREAIYVAAALRGIELVSYDEASHVLRVPISAPLPEVFARCACLCSGRHSRVDAGTFEYESIPNEVARLLCTAIGQVCSRGNKKHSASALAGLSHERSIQTI